MGARLKILRGFFIRFAAGVRELSGDSAYEHYLAHHAAHHAQLPALSRKAYFQQQEQQKWEGVKRCC